jgi:methionine-rich copper-binding protein CopC
VEPFSDVFSPWDRAAAEVGSSRRWIATVILAGAAAWFLGPGADVAQAHAKLTGSSPGAGSTWEVAPTKVILEFNENVQANFAVVTVAGPGGSAISTGHVSVTDNKVIAGVRRPTQPGDYTVAWRVVSEDGHPVDGEFTYTLTRRAMGNTQRSSQPPPVASHASNSSGWLRSATGLLAVVVSVVLVASALLWFQRRRER